MREMFRKKAVRRIAAVLLAAGLLTGSVQAASEDMAQESAEAVLQTETVPVEIDLTPLNQEMLIEKSTEILSNPDLYIGKRIRTVGILQVIGYNDRYITSIYLGDVSECCGTTLEFNLAGEYSWPEDYPPPGTIVYIEGTFERYEEDGMTYTWLNHAVMSLEK